jgi:osmoprotectant transport system substrate-binding protein
VGTRPAPSRWRRASTLALAAVTVGSAACTGGEPTDPAGERADGALTIASFDFPESAVIAELYGQALADAGYRVEVLHEVGPRELLAPALERGLVEFVPEYLGTALGFFTRRPDAATADVNETYRALASELEGRGIVALEPAPAQDANGFAVTLETADRYGLETISDLVPVAGELVFGGPPECPERPLCLQGLQEVYGLSFESFSSLDASGPVTAAALRAGEVDVALLFTTSGYLGGGDLVLLRDDRELQPAENVVPVVRADLLRRLGEGFRDVVESVSRRLTTEDLVELNRLVTLEGGERGAVAGDWLAAHGIVG